MLSIRVLRIYRTTYIRQIYMNKAHASREHFGLFLDVYLSLKKCPAFQDPSI